MSICVVASLTVNSACRCDICLKKIGFLIPLKGFSAFSHLRFVSAYATRLTLCNVPSLLIHIRQWLYKLNTLR